MKTELDCPDCNSEIDVQIVAPGIYRLTIRHDDTCPNYRAMKKENR